MEVYHLDKDDCKTLCGIIPVKSKSPVVVALLCPSCLIAFKMFCDQGYSPNDDAR